MLNVHTSQGGKHLGSGTGMVRSKSREINQGVIVVNHISEHGGWD